MGLLSTPIGLGAKAVGGLMDMSTPASMQREKRRSENFPNNFYHGTDGEIDTTKTGLGLHVGAAHQAEKRLQDISDYDNLDSLNYKKLLKNSKTYPLSTRFNKPLQMPDLVEWHDSVSVIKGLRNLSQFKDNKKLIALEKEAREFDFISTSNPGVNNRILQDVNNLLQDSGYDSIKYKNIFENTKEAERLALKTGNDEPLNSYISLNPDNDVRSTLSAAFNKKGKGLSASNPVATTSAALMANVTGQPSNLSSYMQGNTDAYLTNAERQYLQNKQAFESNFSDDTGWDRADILPFRVNEQTGEREFATPEMIKGLLSGLYDIGQSKNTKISNPASLLELI